MKTDNGPASVKIPVGLTEVTIASTWFAVSPDTAILSPQPIVSVYVPSLPGTASK